MKSPVARLVTFIFNIKNQNYLKILEADCVLSGKKLANDMLRLKPFTRTFGCVFCHRELMAEIKKNPCLRINFLSLRSKGLQVPLINALAHPLKLAKMFGWKD